MREMYVDFYPVCTAFQVSICGVSYLSATEMNHDKLLVLIYVCFTSQTSGREPSECTNFVDVDEAVSLSQSPCVVVAAVHLDRPRIREVLMTAAAAALGLRRGRRRHRQQQQQ